MPDEVSRSPNQYESFLQELKERIRSAQIRAGISVNRK
jgi:hypothetical protein